MRKKASGMPNPKRMFEEAQMVRRVKAYLNHMNIITDEDRSVNLVQGDKVARWQNLIPSFPWIAPGWRAWLGRHSPEA